MKKHNNAKKGNLFSWRTIAAVIIGAGLAWYNMPSQTPPTRQINTVDPTPEQPTSTSSAPQVISTQTQISTPTLETFVRNTPEPTPTITPIPYDTSISLLMNYVPPDKRMGLPIEVVVDFTEAGYVDGGFSSHPFPALDLSGEDLGLAPLAERDLSLFYPTTLKSPITGRVVDLGQKDGASYIILEDGNGRQVQLLHGIHGYKIQDNCVYPDLTSSQGKKEPVKDGNGDSKLSCNFQVQEPINIGDEVHIGQQIGLVFKIGFSGGGSFRDGSSYECPPDTDCGIHAHFEVHVDGTPVSPSNYLATLVISSLPEFPTPEIKPWDPELLEIHNCPEIVTNMILQQAEKFGPYLLYGEQTDAVCLPEEDGFGNHYVDGQITLFYNKWQNPVEVPFKVLRDMSFLYMARTAVSKGMGTSPSEQVMANPYLFANFVRCHGMDPGACLDYVATQMAQLMAGIFTCDSLQPGADIPTARLQCDGIERYVLLR